MSFIQTILLITLAVISSSFPVLREDISSTNYNMSWSIEADKYSAITHCTPQQIKTWNCKLCKQAEKPENMSFFYNQKTSILAFMGYLPSKKVIFITWRGTVDARNWIQDFTYYQIEYPECKNCKVHFGFFSAFVSIEPELMSALQSLMKIYPNAQIVSSGSSLGAALAAVSALQIQLKTNKVTQLHTFGCPRLGNQEYAQFLTNKIKNIFRVVHNRDIVPHVPLITQDYHHFPNQIWFDENMQNYQICDDSGEDPNCSNKFYPDYSIPDHVSYFYKPDMEDLCTI